MPHHLSSSSLHYVRGNTVYPLVLVAERERIVPSLVAVNYTEEMQTAAELLSQGMSRAMSMSHILLQRRGSVFVLYAAALHRRLPTAQPAEIEMILEKQWLAPAAYTFTAADGHMASKAKGVVPLAQDEIRRKLRAHPSGHLELSFAALCQSVMVLLLLSAAFSSGQEIYVDDLTLFTSIDGWMISQAFYFRCTGGEKKAVLGVSEIFTTYNFTKDEPWQPLVILDNNVEKCKRCGLYEVDDWIHDGVLDEFEVCPADFNMKSGKTVVNKSDAFILTLECAGCPSHPHSRFAFHQSGSIPYAFIHPKHLKVFVITF
eukprot:TRINITY_DN7048_c0_g1_i3.p1 TRINITY_DN7048_c0_g1~~TRINITY_DN7048_c0_g1_i3.p1  ORF type:complete len:316 (+),score=33.87 TRINITY_DN7048_c0_g1_i3:43-990(+)